MYLKISIGKNYRMDRLPTFRQLQYFEALAEAGHYRRAAERVGVSQPSLSQQISNLEETLRLKLVERGRAGAVLTPEGREVLVRARRIMEDVADLAETSERMKTGLAGTIRLGSSPTLGPYLLPKVVHRLHERHPTLRLVIREAEPRDLLGDMLDGHLDMILVQLPVQSSDVVVTRLFREPLHLVVARDHRLAARRSAEDPDLAGEPLMTLSSGFALHDQIAGLAGEVGADLRREYEGTSLNTLRQMAAMDMGVAFLPALYVQSEISDSDGDVAVLPFRRGRFTRSIGACWRRSSRNHAGYAAITEIINSVVQSQFDGIVSMEA